MRIIQISPITAMTSAAIAVATFGATQNGPISTILTQPKHGWPLCETASALTATTPIATASSNLDNHQPGVPRRRGWANRMFEPGSAAA